MVDQIDVGISESRIEQAYNYKPVLYVLKFGLHAQLEVSAITILRDNIS